MNDIQYYLEILREHDADVDTAVGPAYGPHGAVFGVYQTPA